MTRVRRAAAEARTFVGGAGLIVLVATGLDGFDLWSGSLAILGLALLIISTVLIVRWPAGPTFFLAAVVLQAAVAPTSSGGQVLALVVAVAGYLWAVESSQTGRGRPDREWLGAQLPPLLTGIAIGAVVVGVVTVCLAAVAESVSGWLAALAGVVATLSSTGVIMLAGRRGSANTKS